MTWFKIDNTVFVKAHTETGTTCVFLLNYVRLAKPTSGSTGTTLYIGSLGTEICVKIEEPFSEYEDMLKQLGRTDTTHERQRGT